MKLEPVITKFLQKRKKNVFRNGLFDKKNCLLGGDIKVLRVWNWLVVNLTEKLNYAYLLAGLHSLQLYLYIEAINLNSWWKFAFIRNGSSDHQFN